MKLNVGSVQQKSGKYYFVTQVEGRRKWTSLKTADPKVARRRARLLVTSDTSEWTWLHHIARLGERAEQELRRRESVASISWDSLWIEYSAKKDVLVSETNELCHERWVKILSETARQLNLKSCDFVHPDAYLRIVSSLISRYISAKRMVQFFQHLWETLGLEPSFWKGLCSKFPNPLSRSEHYRRLAIEEIQNVYHYFTAMKSPFADMILIGYSTGLRMSDVAELSCSEVTEDDRFLRLVPNKTRFKKPHPILIPLTEQVRSAIQRLVKSADGDGYLFASQFRHRPSRRIAAAFRACGVLQIANGRASFHSLRATFISLMDEAGIPPHLTDSITGHTSGGMHARYTQPSAQALLDAVTKAIGPL